MCEPIEQLACGSGHVIARTGGDEVLTWGYPGTWQQLQAYQAATGPAPASGEAGEAAPASAKARFAQRAKVAKTALGVAPQLVPTNIDLAADAYGGPTGASGGIAPLSCRYVAAGR